MAKVRKVKRIKRKQNYIKRMEKRQDELAEEYNSLRISIYLMESTDWKTITRDIGQDENQLLETYKWLEKKLEEDEKEYREISRKVYFMNV